MSKYEKLKNKMTENRESILIKLEEKDEEQYYKIYQECLLENDLVLEVIDKAQKYDELMTAKKQIKKDYEDGILFCPNCKVRIFRQKPNYCEECGCRLE